METRRCIVRGRVQGVGFRWFVARNAEDLGVTGTVRNRSDGTVEAVLQSDSETALESMIERIRKGPSSARVEDVAVEAVEADRDFETMSIAR